MEPTELIQRYAHEVSRHLPRKQQADVETELVTLLHEMLEERAETSGRPIDLALAVDVVRVFGEPTQVAQRYGPPNQYLIGPAMYPTFMTIMRILVIVLICTFMGIAALTVFIGNTPFSQFGSVILGTLSTLFSVIWSVFGGLVLAFAVIERMPGWAVPKPPPWDPMALPEVEDPNRIDRVELVGTVIFSGLALLLFNLFPNWLDYFIVHNGVWGGETVLSPDFFVHLPWFNVSWLLEIGFGLWVLRIGHWTRLTRLFKLALSCLSGVIIYRLIIGGSIVTEPMVDSIIKGGLSVALIVVIIVIGVNLYQLVTGRSLSVKGLKQQLPAV